MWSPYGLFPGMDAPVGHYELYPEVEPFRTGMLGVDGHHKIYFEESGAPDGVPVVFVHGGPGAGAQPIHRRFFDPSRYRIVVFDQRGCGRSKPLACVQDNTTGHLVDDMEQLRRALGIERWLIMGGSWGSTLALAYGVAHPERCLGFILRGIFLGRRREIDWFLYGIRTVFPEAWHAFCEFLPPEARDNLLPAYYRRLTDPDPMVHVPAARAWCRYEGACSNLIARSDSVPSPDRAAVALARMEAHYLINDCFMPRNHLLDNIARLRALPAVLVQGRYDMVCPIVTADTLSRAWPESQYIVIPDAGHSAMEPGIRSALVGATERFKRLLAGW